MVCLHGFMDTWRSWELVLPMLERQHDVLALTLPGHAGGPPVDRSLSTEGFVDAVGHAMDSAGLEIAHLVGNSSPDSSTMTVSESRDTIGQNTRSIDPRMPRNPPASEPRLRKLQAELAAIDFALPGTINVAMNRCGKPSCACHADPPKLHGPYVTWTRKVAGKTVTRRLSPEQLERYQPWFENRRRLRELAGELEALSLEAAEQAEGWTPDPKPPRRDTRRS